MAQNYSLKNDDGKTIAKVFYWQQSKNLFIATITTVNFTKFDTISYIDDRAATVLSDVLSSLSDKIDLGGFASWVKK